MATMVLTQQNRTVVLQALVIPPQQYLGWQITTATASDLVTAGSAISPEGYQTQAICPPTTNPNVLPNWQLAITKSAPQTPQVIADTVNYVAGPSDWIIFDGKHAWVETNESVLANYVVTPYQPPH